MESVPHKVMEGPLETECCGCCDISKPANGRNNNLQVYLPTMISLVLLLVGMGLNFWKTPWFSGTIKLLWFVAAYLPVGGKVLWYAAKNIGKGQVFNEFFLMGIATLGAFFIGEYAEAVAVMLFYVIGEHFQEAAVKKSRGSIKNLIGSRPDKVQVLREGKYVVVHPETVRIGEIIQLKAGEKVALDGTLLNEHASFNTSALTGESKPDTKHRGETVLAGMINLNRVVELKVSEVYENSALSKILLLVEEAVSKKAQPQRFITKFAKIYTPIVVVLALALTFLPYFFLETYVFEDWLYRALVFLVVSCPCALVISIPLGYFGGIGAASKNGILFKGANYLDLMTQIDTVVFDKTGTLTEGVFEVQKVVLSKNSMLAPEEFHHFVHSLEKHSHHPIAQAIVKFSTTEKEALSFSDIEEIPGHGLRGLWNDRVLLAGNLKLLQKFNIDVEPELEDISESMVAFAMDGKYEGHCIVSDKVKGDSAEAIRKLHELGIKEVLMLSGDKISVTKAIAEKLNMDQAFGGLLPQDKLKKLKELKNAGKNLIFVGDGINDAPAITLADVGIAMGGLGSDAAVESADVVIQNDQPSKVVTAIRIAQKTKQIVWQNIGFAFGAKALILILAVFGFASLWGAVFADVGVALLAILNAVRIQYIMRKDA